ncbi:MAG: GTP 3',8-cyclase MoaA [Planctomycetota bacterium]
MVRPHDMLGRPLRNLRLSVTDRCNLRCEYCMPGENYVWLPKQELLTFEEIVKLVQVFTELGVERLRLTGGEPLLRRDLPELVAQLAVDARVKDLAITTNGVTLREHARALRAAGLHRVTVSLDTLRRDRFLALSRRDDHASVLAGIDAVRDAGFTGTKLDAVIMRGVNDDELIDLIEFGKRVAAEVRFIEYMDVGGAMHFTMAKVCSRAQMLEIVEHRYGAVQPVAEDHTAPAERFRLADGTTFGIIASTTAPFCRSCDRSRLTADGVWYLCLYALRGIDLRSPLRAGASAAELQALLAGRWQQRDDRGAEDRKLLHERGALLERDALRADPHLEMHTRGG